MVPAVSEAQQAQAATAVSEGRGAVVAAACAFALGAGAAGWLLLGARWRAAVTGYLDLPPTEQAIAAVASLTGLWWGTGLAAHARQSLFVGAGLVLAAVGAFVAVAAVPPGITASPVGGVLTQAPVLGAAGVVAGALLQTGGARAAVAIAAGAAAAIASAPLFASQPAFGTLGAATIMLLLAGALAPAARTGSRSAAALPGSALPVLALPVGTAWALGWERPVAALSGGALAAALTVLGAAAALCLGAGVPARHRARVGAVSVAALVLAFDPTVSAAFALACASGLLLAQAAAGAAARAIALFGLGAACGVASSWVGTPADGIAAGAAVLALLTSARRSALAWVALAVVVAVATARVGWPPSVRAVDGETTVLARDGAATASYRARRQELALAVGNCELDVAGPDHAHAVLAAACTAAMAPSGAVAVLGSGTGRIRGVLASLQVPFLAVEPSAAAASLQPFLALDGPVPAATQPTTQLSASMQSPWVAGTREFVWSLPRGACAAIVGAEPLSAAAPARAEVDEHAAMRRAVGRGLVVQCFRLDATPPDVLQTALAAASSVHPWCGVFLCGRAGAIVGLGRAPDLARTAAVIDDLPWEPRWRLHEAGLGSGVDFADALLGVVVPGAPGSPGRPGADGASHAAAANARTLAEALRLPPDTMPAWRLQAQVGDASARQRAVECLQRAARARPARVLVARELVHAERRIAAAAIAAVDPNDAGQVAAAAALAARWQQRAGDSAVLQAALALPDRRGGRAREPSAAGMVALALDPGLQRDAPAVLRPIVAGLPPQSPLADFAVLPEPSRLADLAAGDGPLAIALRARFPSRCAQALVAAWRHAPLPGPALAALAELADAFVLANAAHALAQRGAGGELLLVWREDLPATPAVANLASGPPACRHRCGVAAVAGARPRRR
jgi:hypothetical protein